MSWTSPSTIVAGTQVLASWANSNVRDNALFLYAKPANRCEAYHNTTQAGGTNETTVLNMNNEDQDSNGMHDLVTNNNRVTIPTGGDGYYIARGQTRAATNAGTSFAKLQLRKNGTVLRSDEVPSGAKPYVLKVAVIGHIMAANDYFDLAGVSDGSGSNTYGSSSSPFDQGTRLDVIGPLPNS